VLAAGHVYLYEHATLDALLRGNRWLGAAEYLSRSLLLHHDDDDSAGPAPADEMPREHPELIVLLRRQHALELLGDGKREAARQYYYDKSIFAPTRLVHRTRHLDALLSDLRDSIIAAADSDGGDLLL